MRDLLEHRVTGAGDRIAPLVLTNDKATRQGIIDAWRSHLGQASRDDVALFYYSGHGSQENAPPEFWGLEPDRLNETLVCYDSRQPGGWDLADKELAQLIAEVAAERPHVVVVLDCCHSGSGTRDAARITVRQQKADDRARPIDTYIVTPQQAAALQGNALPDADVAMRWSAIARGRHVTLAACRPQQTAKETFFQTAQGMEKRGAFSYYLQDTLQQTGEMLTYRDLFKRISTLVQARVIDQAPQLDATDPGDLEQGFLGGIWQPGVPYFTLSSDTARGWWIDGGAVHGILPSSNGEAAHLAIFPFDTPPASLVDLRKAVAQATVREVRPGESLVDVVPASGVALDQPAYKAVVTSLPLIPLTVSLEGDAEALDLVRQALAYAGPGGTPSLLVREGRAGETEYKLQADAANDRFRIARTADAWEPEAPGLAAGGVPVQRNPLAVDTPGVDARAAELVVRRLEHIARWARVIDLRNRITQIPADAIKLEILRERDGGVLEALDSRASVRLEYERKNGQWQPAKFRIKLTNTGSVPYYCLLMDLPETYAIHTGLLPDFAEPLAPGEERWAQVQVGQQWRTTLDAHLPDDLWKQGVTELRDVLKLVVSTVELDPRALQQDELPVQAATRGFRNVPMPQNTLQRLMARVATRHIGAASSPTEELADWTTTEVSFTTVRPTEATTG
jgi:hypothetical protein